MILPPAGRLTRLLLLPVAAGYLLHLIDETRLGLPFEWKYLVPTLLLLALAAAGFLLRRPLLALPSAAIGGFLVAYFGGLGHLLPFGRLYPMSLGEGLGGWITGLNSLSGLVLTVFGAASCAALLRAERSTAGAVAPTPDSLGSE